MATVQKIITLTQEGENAGPYYDIYTSLDCLNFVLNTANAYLPNVNDSIEITVDSNTQCYRLVNKSTNCNQNMVTKGNLPDLLPSIRISDGCHLGHYSGRRRRTA